MPLPLPNLDDRTWAELVDEGRALIPLYAPEWTDHNVHDPGITLVELFALLAEMDIYQLNRIPERHRRKFLALVGLRPERPSPARTVVSFTTKKRYDQEVLPATLEIEGNDPFGRPTRLRTLEEVYVVAAELRALQLRDHNGFHDLTRRWRNGEQLQIFGDNPAPGVALYLGISPALPTKVPISLFFSLVGPQAGEEERARIVQELVAQKAACRAPDAIVTCEKSFPPSVETASDILLPHHSVRTVWEFLAGKDEWRRLEAVKDEVEDGTRAFTLSGRVLITLPTAMAGARLGQVDSDFFYLRCRFLAGAYDEAPMLANLALHGVAAEQAVPPDLEPEQLGVGTGTPRQQFTTSQKPVVETSFRLFTFEDGYRREWRLVWDFDASARNDLHFLLDPTLGQVSFGDGEKGRVVPSEIRIEARYLATRAEAGNLAAGTITKLAKSNHNRSLKVDANSLDVNNPVPATRGAAAEPLVHAEGRAVELMQQPTRAVTLSDYEWFAKRTPGVRLARAEAKANLHPGFPCLKAPGMIAVLVLPFLPAGRPVPSKGLLEEVAAYLHTRRILGTRVEVFGPTYVDVVVQARVQGFPGTSATALASRITAGLNRFFDPLEGGSDRNGWPFGRDVFRSEVLQVIGETEGVDHVLAMELIANGGEPQCGNVCVGPAGLVAGGQHKIEVM
jgi:predicted phage baseplate assembly protein